MNDVEVKIGWMEGEEKLCHLYKGGGLKKGTKEEY